MTRRVVKGNRVPGDPLQHIYWKCPARGCDAFHRSFAPEMENKEMECDTCKTIYLIVHIISETSVSARIVIEFKEPTNGNQTNGSEENPVSIP